MSALPTRIEKEAGRPLTPLEIFNIAAARETTLSRLLMLYIGTGLVFMPLPGTFPGCLEADGDRQPSFRRFRVSCMDSGARARADLRLDRYIHPGYR